MLHLNTDEGSAQEALTRLVYELLDAHDDTVQLAVESSADPRWGAHLAYARDLQRVGREVLARATAEGGRSPGWPR